MRATPTDSESYSCRIEPSEIRLERMGDLLTMPCFLDTPYVGNLRLLTPLRAPWGLLFGILSNHSI